MGRADGQNCAGGVCLRKSKRQLGYAASGMVDWWRKFVYVHSELRGRDIAYVYAHYDSVEALFDGGETDLQKLLRRTRRRGAIKITLYPKKRGYHPRTGQSLKPAGNEGTHSQKHRIGPRAVGNELRFLNRMSAHAVPAPQQ